MRIRMNIIPFMVRQLDGKDVLQMIKVSSDKGEDLLPEVNNLIRKEGRQLVSADMIISQMAQAQRKVLNPETGKKLAGKYMELFQNTFNDLRLSLKEGNPIDVQTAVLSNSMYVIKKCLRVAAKEDPEILRKAASQFNETSNVLKIYGTVSIKDNSIKRKLSSLAEDLKDNAEYFTEQMERENHRVSDLNNYTEKYAHIVPSDTSIFKSHLDEFLSSIKDNQSLTTHDCKVIKTDMKWIKGNLKRQVVDDISQYGDAINYLEQVSAKLGSLCINTDKTITDLHSSKVTDTLLDLSNDLKKEAEYFRIHAFASGYKPNEILPDAIKSGYKYCSSISDAEQFARSLGIKVADYGKDLFNANLYNMSLVDFKNKGLDLPEVIQVTPLKSVGIFKVATVFTPYEEPKTILGLKKELDKQYLINQGASHSTNGPKHILDHEFSHFLHFNNFKKTLPPDTSNAQAYKTFCELCSIKFSDPERTLIEKNVSLYGASNAAELVAEVTTAIKDGKTFPPEIMDMYKKYTAGEVLYR